MLVIVDLSAYVLYVIEFLCPSRQHALDLASLIGSTSRYPFGLLLHEW